METVGHNFGGPEKRRGLGLQVALCSLYQTKLRTDPPALGFLPSTGSGIPHNLCKSQFLRSPPGAASHPTSRLAGGLDSSDDAIINVKNLAGISETRLFFNYPPVPRGP